MSSSPLPPDEVERALKRAKFKMYELEGDEARKAGKLSAAGKAYMAALSIMPNPLVSGRLGVIFVKLGQPTDAADLLLEALTHAVTTPAERQEFLRSYDTAKAQTTWVDIVISHANAKLTIDGEPRNPYGYSALAVFVMPGVHEFRAQLEGYEDAVQTFTAFAGRRLPVTLNLKPLPKLVPKPEHLRREGRRMKIPGLDDPPPDEPLQREPIQGGVIDEPKKPGPRLSVSAGPVFVFGVASWSPAVGAVIGGSWRANEFVSLGLEGRAAWLTSGLKGNQIYPMTAGGIASLCGHYRWFYGCGLGYLGVIRVEFSSASYLGPPFTAFNPGVGARAGGKLPITDSFALQASADVLALASGLKIAAGQTIIVEQAPLMFGAQVIGTWEF